MKNLSVVVSEHPHRKEITLLTVKGSIDTVTSPEFEEKFLSVLKANKFKLVIDLSGVDYISSVGWGLFVSEIKKIREQKGDVLLAGMTPEVAEIFELLEFNTFMKSFPSVESAVSAGFGGSPAVKKKDVPASRFLKATP